MMNPKNECIDARAFASLILDYEFPGDEIFEPLVSCRVLIEDLYNGSIAAKSREEAIEIFRSGSWRR